MRIHRLEVVAFGPFAERTTVDLDALSDAGLFLLTGATGAGKTSILDAICFALYGAVPGDRQDAKRLRSDHAAPGVAPEVSMELTVSGRRFRIHRSPAWSRPKKRGTGHTTEQPSVLVEERVDGAWQPLASRLDEAGHLVGGLLGMTLTQFCQVQLLPQGRFQAFLRASSKERHALLQKLFRTARFEGVETWLRERRRALQRDTDHHHDRVAVLASRVSEAAGVPLPAPWDPQALGPVADEVASWTTTTLEGAQRAQERHRAEAEVAATAEQQARASHEAGLRLLEQQQRHARARVDLAALDAEAEAHAARVDRLGAARRAESLRPVLAEAARTAAARAAADEEATRTAELAARLLGTDLPRPEVLLDQQRQAATRAAECRARRPLLDEQARLESALAQGDAARAAVEQDLETLEGELVDLPGRLADRRDRATALRRAVDGLSGARQEADAAAARLAAGREVASLVAERSRAEALHRVAVDLAQDLKERWLSIQERRLSGMAAEIAGGLVVGGCCPVCGSADHPHPARPAHDSPDGETEREARRALDDAEVERHARAEAVRDLETRITLARERSAGRPVPVLEREAADAAARVTRLEASAEQLPGAEAALVEAEEEEQRLRARHTALLTHRAALTTAHDERCRRAAEVRADLAELLAGTDHTSVPALLAHLEQVEQACADAVAARDVATRREADARAAGLRLADALEHGGFASATDAEAADLPDDEAAALAEQVRDHELTVAAVEAVLADDDLRRAAEQAAPDLAGSAAALAAAEEALVTARAAATRAGERAERLVRLGAELDDALASWRPLREELALAESLASLTDGTSPDNRLRMRLSGYVLAHRLQQVVEAANERLVGMTDSRYRLEHTGDRGAGESRGGLSLRVLDDWTGEARDPVTLSGGETFVVSLALALGLADVITYEAGGAELDTLFVDEGFGTLDPETLDDVLAMLDGLRDGGRVVGVVSHVPEMRDRIPTRLHVRKLRTGSTVHQEHVG